MRAFHLAQGFFKIFCIFISYGYYTCSIVAYVAKVLILRLHKYAISAYNFYKFGYNIVR